MKNRIVLWGENPSDQKVLLAFALRAADNRVDLHIIPAADVSEQMEKDMMTKWRKGEEIPIPSSAERRELELKVTDGLLPDDLKTNDTDLIARAQAEWHFAVLSAKMQAVYQSELEDLRETVGNLTDYDSAVWESLKGFWGKVQKQAQDGNLLRSQAEQIKRGVNEAFATMKELRSKADKEFSGKSAQLKTEFFEKVDEIEKKVEDGARLSPLFDQLKGLQKKYFNSKFTRDHRDQVWKRIDGAFKTVKEKRYGSEAATQSPAGRTERRLQGLHGAIEKMERSIKRDEDDLKFNERKIERTEGQLEAQIRKAKMVMIEERLNSKRTKLEDMVKTRTDLENRLAREKKKEEQRQEKERQREERRRAEESRKAEIAAKIAAQQQAVSEEEAAKLRDAAAKISGKDVAAPAVSNTAAAAAAAAASTAGAEEVAERMETPTPAPAPEAVVTATADTAEMDAATTHLEANAPTEEPDAARAEADHSSPAAGLAGGPVHKTTTDPQPTTAAPKADYATATPVQDDDNLIEHAASVGIAVDEAVHGPVDAPDDADLDTTIEPQGETLLSAIGNTLGESVQDVTDTVRATITVLADKLEDKVDELKDNLLGDAEEE